MNNKNISMSELYPIISEKLANGGEVTFTVSGISMQPMVYNKRDSVTLAKPTAMLKNHDLIFYRRDDGSFILHRIIKKQKNGNFVCRGDNQWNKEFDVRPDQIIGVTVSFNRNGKNVVCAKSFGYKFYCFIWPFAHHFKPLYKYFRK